MFRIPPTLRAYRGGKRGEGVAQRLICEIPPHETYIEGFLGGGGVLAAKRPALQSYMVDIDETVIETWRNYNRHAIAQFVCGDAMAYLRMWRQPGGLDRHTTFIYLDPPFLGSSRVSDKACYRHEMVGEAQHNALLGEMLSWKRAHIMISTYPNDLYAEMLGHWTCWEMQVQTRRGPALQHVYQNYPRGGKLHDYRYLGADYRERERIRRKVKRWTANLAELPPRERAAILEALNDRAAMLDVTESVTLS